MFLPAFAQLHPSELVKKFGYTGFVIFVVVSSVGLTFGPACGLALHSLELITEILSSRVPHCVTIFH